MSHSKRSFRQPSSEELGNYLTSLRVQKRLTRAEATRKLGLKNPQQLYNYEIGRTVPSTSLLIRLAHLYNAYPDEVLARAYWPQLTLLPLVSIIDPERLSEDLIDELEKGLEEAERQELTLYIEQLLLRRSMPSNVAASSTL